jgi:hypothetical protein
LDVDYDLSHVFFIATANVLHTIPPPLQDRLEILNLSGYTEREKVEIAKRHLIAKQCENTGIDTEKVTITDDGILEVIRHYTREAGVRNLEREIGSCLRKIARKFVASEEKDSFKVIIDAEKVRELLGTIRFRKQDIARKSEIGLVNGLAWTEVGGDVLQVRVEAGGGLLQQALLEHAAHPGPQAGLQHREGRAQPQLHHPEALQRLPALLPVAREGLPRGQRHLDPARPFPSHPRLAAWWAHLSQDPVFGTAMDRYRGQYREWFGSLSTPRAFGNWLKARAPRP